MNQARAVIIRDDQKRFKDLEDVVKVARALGQQIFKTHENVFVKRIWHDSEYGYIVIVEGPSTSLYRTSECKRQKKYEK